MEILLVIFSVVTLGAVIFAVHCLRQLQKPQEDKRMDLLYQQLESLRQDMRETDGRSREEIQRRIDSIGLQINSSQQHSTNVIKEITEKLVALDSTNKQVVGFAEQMKSLENILKNPKQRGILGEYMLDTLLHNILPPKHYQLQYRFPNAEIVDAVIFFNDTIIPIDAKFSLEKYNLMVQENDSDRRSKLEKEFKMDVKNRIDETAKYIRPHEGTTEFAFMFIPAEGIYYNLLIYDVGSVKVNTHDLIEYAFRKKVIIVSPTSFFAYLETVLHGLKALKMEQSVHEIIAKVRDLDRHLKSHGEGMDKLGKHLGTTVSMFNQAHREFRKIDKDIYKLTDGQAGGDIDLIELAKPELLDAKD